MRQEHRVEVRSNPMGFLGCCLSKLKANKGISIFGRGIVSYPAMELCDRDEIFGLDLHRQGQVMELGSNVNYTVPT